MFDDSVGPEMEEALSLDLQSLPEPVFFDWLLSDSFQDWLPLPEAHTCLDKSLELPSSLTCPETQTLFPPEASVSSVSLPPTNIGAISPSHTYLYNASWIGQNNISAQNMEPPPVFDQPGNPPQPPRASTKRRAPKAPIMSVEKWRPHQNRIRQLYIAEGKPIEELREIMNKELGIKAT